MTDDEVFQVVWRYREQFGDDALPGLDYLPTAYRHNDAYAELLERCMTENKPVNQLIELIKYPLDVLI
ncbi:MAG: hypothetical protein RR482_00115 [Clostridia bacterium]